jgi:hypothetical protein
MSPENKLNIKVFTNVPSPKALYDFREKLAEILQDKLSLYNECPEARRGDTKHAFDKLREPKI